MAAANVPVQGSWRKIMACSPAQLADFPIGCGPGAAGTGYPQQGL